jgi:hypothetical protein
MQSNTIMSKTHERIMRESIAQHEFRKRLEPLVTLNEELDAHYNRCINGIADHPRNCPAAKVGLILVSRIANDLRVCSLTSQLGYGLQALVIGGTIIELVGALCYVGESDNRAASWAEHSDHRHSYPPKVADGIEAIVTALGITDPSAKDQWQQAYAFMCMAKHGNPFLSLLHGIRIMPSGAEYTYGPDISDLGRYFAAEALFQAVGFGTAGTIVAARHCASDELKTELIDESCSIRNRLLDLDPWFHEVTKPDRGKF